MPFLQNPVATCGNDDKKPPEVTMIRRMKMITAIKTITLITMITIITLTTESLAHMQSK